MLICFVVFEISLRAISYQHFGGCACALLGDVGRCTLTWYTPLALGTSTCSATISNNFCSDSFHFLVKIEGACFGV